MDWAAAPASMTKSASQCRFVPNTTRARQRDGLPRALSTRRTARPICEGGIRSKGRGLQRAGAGEPPEGAACASSKGNLDQRSSEAAMV